MAQKMNISGNRSVEELQQEFNTVFPDLKLNFFHHAHKSGMPSDKADAVGPHERVSDIRFKEADGQMPLDSSMTVAQFENEMRDRFGLSVQVFRRSGEQWIQTTITDHWTLGHQEEDGHDSVDFHYGE